MRIRDIRRADLLAALAVVNRAAQAYRGDVTLIRHAYVAPAAQGKGVGTKLLRELQERTRKPLLIGTWADASWAVAFYRRNGFRLTTPKEKSRLLRRYWSIPERQIETSVVLVQA